MASFDYSCFCGDYSCLGFNAGKYSKEEALKIGAEEYCCDISELLIEEAYIYYGFGIDCEGERRQGYWICDTPKKNGFRAWSVRKGGV